MKELLNYCQHCNEALCKLVDELIEAKTVKSRTKAAQWIEAEAEKYEAEPMPATRTLNIYKYRKKKELGENSPKIQRGIKFNESNENIEWARWTWNPVTGCRHGCKYCYARDIANRFYKEKFKPTFHRHRLLAPKRTEIPKEDFIKCNKGKHMRWTKEGSRNVFVCSMADLFGDWVPEEWIDAVLATVRDSPQWNFIFLTKNPKRLAEIDWPDNTAVGATVDTQSRVKPTEMAFRKINAKYKFVSCEPLLEPIGFEEMDLFNGLIIGGRSGNSKGGASQPNRKWVFNLLYQAEQVEVPDIYLKPNLLVYKHFGRKS